MPRIRGKDNVTREVLEDEDHSRWGRIAFGPKQVAVAAAGASSGDRHMAAYHAAGNQAEI